MDEQATATTDNVTTAADAGCVINEEWFGRTVVVSASGVVDMLTSPHLEASLTTSLKRMAFRSTRRPSQAANSLRTCPAA